MNRLRNITLFAITIATAQIFAANEHRLLEKLGNMPYCKFTHMDLYNFKGCIDQVRKKAPPSANKLKTARKKGIKIDCKKDLTARQIAITFNALTTISELIEPTKRQEIIKALHDGVRCFQRNNFDHAEKYWKFTSDYGNCLQAMCALGNLYEKQNKSDLAERYYKKAVKYDFLPALNALAQLYEEQNKIELAKQYYEVAAHNHRHASAMNNLGYIYEKEEAFDQAIEYYTYAVAEEYSFAKLNLLYMHAKGHSLPQGIEFSTLVSNLEKQAKETYKEHHSDRWQVIEPLIEKYDTQASSYAASSASSSACSN